MENSARHKYILIFTNNYNHWNRKRWIVGFDQLEEADGIIADNKEKATGYALYDFEKADFLTFKDFVFDDHAIDNFNLSRI